MAWTSPLYSKSAVDRAGQAIISLEPEHPDFINALFIVNNWRSSHSFPLNTFQMGLRRKSKLVDSDTLIAQRIKRLSSIETKLHRFPKMNLSQMQDIGGCRAVLKNTSQVRELSLLYRSADFKHKLMRCDDYLDNPQVSGYRGIHLIYRYYSDKIDTYNGLQIEIQLRSLLQHAWATAVETVGTFLKQALKSSQGHAEWLRFFSLMGSALAQRERTGHVPNTPTNKLELLRELKKLSIKLDVERRLETYGNALQTLEDPSALNAHYFLLSLNPARGEIIIYGFGRRELEQATNKYLEIERSIDNKSGSEAVLVSVESIAALKRAYPNYFLDTRVFLSAVRRALAD